MTQANSRGLGWARIVSAVLVGINTIDVLISLFLVHAAVTVIIGLVIWLVGLATVVLIFSKDSGPFYEQRPAHGGDLCSPFPQSYRGQPPPTGRQQRKAAHRDARDDGEAACGLDRPDRVTEKNDACRRADQRLQVEEGR